MLVFDHIIVMSIIYLIGVLFLWTQVHYSRQLSLFHGALFGIGAYSATILVMRFSWSWLAAILFAAIIGGIITALIAVVLSKTKDDGYALATLGFQMIIYNLFVVLESWTGGPSGIFYIPPIFSNRIFFIAFITLFAIGCAVFLFILPSTQFGRQCRAMGDDPLLYETYGFSKKKLKFLLGFLSGIGAAIAGVLLVAHLHVAEPALFQGGLSISLLAIVFLIPGRPLVSLSIGCILFAAIPELLRNFQFTTESTSQIRHLLFSLLLILAAFRQGTEPEALPGAFRNRE
jgi:branched-chain amino acid transport system permease protein